MRATTFPQELAKWIINEWMALRGTDLGHPLHYAAIVETYRLGLVPRGPARDLFRAEFAGRCLTAGE